MNDARLVSVPLGIFGSVMGEDWFPIAKCRSGPDGTLSFVWG